MPHYHNQDNVKNIEGLTNIHIVWQINNLKHFPFIMSIRIPLLCSKDHFLLLQFVIGPNQKSLIAQKHHHLISFAEQFSMMGFINIIILVLIINLLQLMSHLSPYSLCIHNNLLDNSTVTITLLKQYKIKYISGIQHAHDFEW